MTKLTKREFKAKYGFYPHEECCRQCGRRRADHSIWNTDPSFTCQLFVPAGRKA